MCHIGFAGFKFCGFSGVVGFRFGGFGVSWFGLGTYALVFPVGLVQYRFCWFLESGFGGLCFDVCVSWCNLGSGLWVFGAASFSSFVFVFVGFSYFLDFRGF